MLENLNAKTLQQSMQSIGEQAVEAGRKLGVASSKDKNDALALIAKEIRGAESAILKANDEDVAAAQERGLKASLVDRLRLDPQRVEAIAVSVEDVAKLDDPVGKVLETWEQPSGLRFKKVSVPLGVIGVIYESRPNVTADAAALCLKAGNATILRGGSDSFASSGEILAAIQRGLAASALPEASVQRVPTRDREAVGMLLKMSEYVDVIVPRGGRGLIERVQTESRVPVFSHLDGLCHTYVDASADLDKALAVVLNAKMRRTGICGATETLLVHEEIAESFLPSAVAALEKAGCEIRGDKPVTDIIASASAANEQDWQTEYLDAILSVKVVADVSEAVEHINRYGSHHTEAVIASDEGVLDQFAAQVDAGIVMLNASTQFADGGEFGMGAEIGISTGKMHARGPVGTAQLTSYKYIVAGDGTTRP